MRRTMVPAVVALFALALLTRLAGTLGPVDATVTGYQVVVGETVADSTASKQLKVSCPAGKKAMGAGWGVLDPTGAILDGSVTYFEPAFDGSHWLANARKNSSFAAKWKLRVRVTCS
ncbi:MAG TPA: hypothetical protein VN493_01015 [Thermoanaerobaculia bacterium]|nr:hypothetical protein [Thermoanaerobaculia bacterium]